MSGRNGIRTLISAQERAIKQMLEPRTSERRAVKHRAAVLRDYRKLAAKFHYLPSEIEVQVKDIRDMYELERDAE